MSNTKMLVIMAPQMYKYINSRFSIYFWNYRGVKKFQSNFSKLKLKSQYIPVFYLLAVQKWRGPIREKNRFERAFFSIVSFVLKHNFLYMENFNFFARVQNQNTILGRRFLEIAKVRLWFGAFLTFLRVGRE